MHGEELERTMLAFIKREVRHPGRDHDHRERPGHPQRQHDLHQRGRQVRPGRPAPAPRPGRPLQAPGLCLPAARVGQVGHAQRGQAAEGDRGVHRSSGAGFKIALRDLEIRGAGNILGAEQSGHIESVGYELYCSLLESAARALTNQPEKPLFDCSVELGWRAYLPRDYVPAPRIKLELYRRLGRLRTLNHLADFRQEMIDRFGPLPRPAENLLIETEIRIMAGAWKLERIHVETGAVRRPDLRRPDPDRSPGPPPSGARSGSSTPRRRTSRWAKTRSRRPRSPSGCGPCCGREDSLT